MEIKRAEFEEDRGFWDSFPEDKRAFFLSIREASTLSDEEIVKRYGWLYDAMRPKAGTSPLLGYFLPPIEDEVDNGDDGAHGGI